MKSLISIENIKNKIESELKSKDINCTFQFQFDEDTKGYLYYVKTKYAVGIFSDNTVDNELRMFIIMNSALNYAIYEDLSDDQFLDYKSCMEVPSIDEFIYILGNPIQQPKVKA